MADVDSSNEQTHSEAQTKNLSPGEAAGLVSTTVMDLRQQWLQAAVTIANKLKSGSSVNHGTFDDLKRLREHFEELERARIVLAKLNAPEGSGNRPGANS